MIFLFFFFSLSLSLLTKDSKGIWIHDSSSKRYSGMKSLVLHVLNAVLCRSNNWSERRRFWKKNPRINDDVFFSLPLLLTVQNFTGETLMIHSVTRAHSGAYLCEYRTSLFSLSSAPSTSEISLSKSLIKIHSKKSGFFLSTLNWSHPIQLKSSSSPPLEMPSLDTVVLNAMHYFYSRLLICVMMSQIIVVITLYQFTQVWIFWGAAHQSECNVIWEDEAWIIRTIIMAIKTCRWLWSYFSHPWDIRRCVPIPFFISPHNGVSLPSFRY